MDPGQKFLVASLGQDGAKALLKAVEREPELASVLIPRAIVGWLDFTTEHEYEGPIPGVENSYVQFQKSEEGFAGTISLEEGAYTFEKSSVYHLAAGIAMALGLEPSSLDAEVRDTVLVKLGKSIDTLTKAQVLVQELKSPKTSNVTRMTTHGGYHIEHSGKPDPKPYTVVHTRTNSPVQAGIASLKDAQDIANWHHNRYRGLFHPELNKKSLNPSAGYKITHENHDLGKGEFLTKFNATRNGQPVGEAVFSHKGDKLVPESVHIDPGHRRQGLASAMYAKAEEVMNKKVDLDKVELPGRTHKPTPQQGPTPPTPPMKQPANAVAKPLKPPKIPSLAIGKSEAESTCSMCGGHQFENHKFKGCICFRDLAKSVHTTAYGDGYVLSFKTGMDRESVQSLVKAFRSKNG